MAYEDGEIEDGEVPEDGEVREENANTNGNENSEKRKATSPPPEETGEKRIKVAVDENGTEEGECVSDDGEINSPEHDGMDVDKNKAEDGELELDLSDVELFQDKNMNDIEWNAILPITTSEERATERATFSTSSILRSAQVHRHSSYLIRNEKLLYNLENIFADSNGGANEQKNKPKNPLSSRHYSLSRIIAENREKLGLEQEIPLRPFMPPTRFNGALAHEITQYILDGNT